MFKDLNHTLNENNEKALEKFDDLLRGRPTPRMLRDYEEGDEEILSGTYKQGYGYGRGQR